MRLPVIAIVGRPNVGKSTLFNRLAKRRISIVEDLPGVTRDRLYTEASFEGIRYTVIDTGGFEPNPDTPLFEAVRDQTRLAIEEADVVLFLVDGRAGLTPSDIEVANMLRKSGAALVVGANKADSPNQDALAGELYELGVEVALPVSAAHGRGISELMAEAIKRLSPELREAGKEAERARKQSDAELSDESLDRALDEAEGDTGEGAPKKPHLQLPEVLRIAIIGKPNAGKSSFVNKLLGEERHLVSPMPGTTVDAVDSFLEYGGARYRLIDTAGIRRKRSISQQVEKYAVVSALKAMDRCDVALFLLDATEGITEQDLKVAAFAEEKGKGIVLCLNKWDLAKGTELDAKKAAQDIRDRMPHLSYAPIRFVSAKTGRKVFDVLDTANEVARQCYTRVPTSQVNKVIEGAVNAHQPAVNKGRRVKLFFGAQVQVAPPTFVIATNDPEGVHFSYRRFVTNQLREAFGFEGVPLRVFFRLRGDKEGREKNIEARKRSAALTKNKRKGQKKAGPKKAGAQKKTSMKKIAPKKKAAPRKKAGATKSKPRGS
jgi:GTPase